jgi:hypothetical protein
MAKKPTDIELAVQKVTGMKPGLDRASILPFYTDKSGRNHPSAPQFLYDAAKAFVVPGVAAQGGKYDTGDVVNMAMNVTGGGLGASRVARPTVRAGEQVLATSVKPKTAVKEVEKLAAKYEARKLTEHGLYSHAAETAAQLPQAKGTPQQMEAMLRKYGVKPDELKHSGFTDAFGDRPSVTRDEIVAHFQDRLPPLQKTVLKNEPLYPTDVSWTSPITRSPTKRAKFSEYTTPGGENYREVLIHLPTTAQKYDTALAALKAKYPAISGTDHMPLQP